MRVLDLCAAPGGKSSQLAAALQGQGLLVSNEYVAARAEILKSNLERMGVSNAVVLNETPAASQRHCRSSSTAFWWMRPAPVRGCSAKSLPRWPSTAKRW